MVQSLRKLEGHADPVGQFLVIAFQHLIQQGLRPGEILTIQTQEPKLG